MTTKPAVYCEIPDVFQDKLSVLFLILESALAFSERCVELSHRQINERLAALEAKIDADKRSNDVPILLTEREVSAMLGVRHTTIHELARRGDLPKVKGMGRGTRYRLEDIERLLSSGFAPLRKKTGGRRNASGN